MWCWFFRYVIHACRMCSSSFTGGPTVCHVGTTQAERYRLICINATMRSRVGMSRRVHKNACGSHWTIEYTNVCARSLAFGSLPQIGYVGQEPLLFQGTILENIVKGAPGASLELIQNAAKAANAHNFITSFNVSCTCFKISIQ